MQHARPNRLRRAVAYAALAALLGTVTMVLSQCTLVGDSLTGVDLHKNDRSNCVTNCNRIYEAALADCKKNCADQACYNDCQAAANVQKHDCMNSCHKQGSGSAG